MPYNYVDVGDFPFHLSSSTRPIVWTTGHLSSRCIQCCPESCLCKYKAVDQPQRPPDVFNPTVEITQVLRGLICHSPVCCEDAVDAEESTTLFPPVVPS